MTRTEITVLLAAILVGLFDWTGIVYLEKNSQARYAKAQTLRVMQVSNDRAICGALHVTTCQFPKE